MSVGRDEPFRSLLLQGPEATEALGRRLAEAVRPGDFIGLVGELGAGKTHLTRAICEALGVPEEQIASPTFAIVHGYEGGRVAVQHADLYRLHDEEELYGTGYFDLLGGPWLFLVEWIDRIPEAAPADWLRIELHHESPERRRAELRAHGPRSQALLQSLHAAE